MSHPSTPLPASANPPAGIAAMLLAAGRGERMRPLTDSTPKPLLQVRGKPLMQWPLEALARGGFTRAVVNTAWLGDQISQAFGSVLSLQPLNNKRKQLSNKEQSQPREALQICYSHEGQDFGYALETAGGIVRALPQLCRPSPVDHAETAGADVFWVLAGDVFVPDFEFRQTDVDDFIASGKLAHLWLVPNPAHNLKGDFGLSVNAHDPQAAGLALNLSPHDPQPRYTYSTIGLYRRALFERPWCDIPKGNPQGVKAPLAPLLRAAMDHGLVSAELLTGDWTDVGTPERLHALNQVQDSI